ncbi:MAG TPA: hypothetical protein VGL13_09170, partial [Polyangiaceae bacterium]
ARSSGPSAAGWIALGVGVAAAGAGTYFALHALSLKNDADRDCPNDQCVGNGSQENRDAIKSANIATVGFAVGIVGVGLGTILLATSGRAAAIAQSGAAITHAGFSFAPGGKAELSLAGRF